MKQHENNKIPDGNLSGNARRGEFDESKVIEILTRIEKKRIATRRNALAIAVLCLVSAIIIDLLG